MREFRNILVVCDEDSAYEHAFERVCWLAQSHGSRVTLVDVIETAPGDLSQLFRTWAGDAGAGEIEEEIVALHRARLEDMAEPLRQQQVQVTTLVLLGAPFVQIIRQVMRDGHDLVIKGAQRSRARPMLSDPDIELLRRCGCPVWVLNVAAGPRARRILAAVDPDPEDETRDRLNWQILDFATALARRDGAWLDVVNAWRLPEESALRHGRARVPEAEVERLLANAQRQSDWRLQRLTADFAGSCEMMRVLHIKGVATDVILDHVETDGIDTVVMGTMGRTGLAGLVVGNTAEGILKRVACSVLTVKPEDFVPQVPAGGPHEMRAQ